MGKLIKEWVRKILTESIQTKVIVYGGRFQPFHKGHYETYKHLVEKFGKGNVYIGTSNKTDKIKSPFNFKEKKLIMTKMFKIPASKVIQIRNPYSPKEILSKFPKDTTAFITVLGEKDRYRLKGKYFDPYHPDRIQKPYMEKGYVYIAPSQSNPISGTEVRSLLSKGDETQRKLGFKKAYNGKFNPQIFNLLSGRLYKIESTLESFLKSIDIHKIISEAGALSSSPGEPEDRYTPPGKQRTINVLGKEQWLNRGGYTQLHFPTADDMYPEGWDDATIDLDNREKSAFNPRIDEPDVTTDFLTINVGGETYSVFDNKLKEASTNGALGKSMVDDGPGFFFGDFKSYKSVNDDLAFRLGFEVVDYILNPSGDSIYADDKRTIDDGYPVSFFPSGISGVDSISYKSIIDSPDYQTWKKHITNVATQVGYKLYEFLNKNQTLITEGGAYGHMNHPFDIKMNLTFGDLKNIVRGALTGNLELTREKTDGQALAISWRDDRGLIAARNKSHLKNSGENALDISGVASKFQGRGGLTDAYNFAMVDLSKAIKSLSKSERDSIFQQGSSFMNLEVIYPESVNVIPYGQPLLIFHGTMEYDESGKSIGENRGSAKKLADMIKKINQNVQKNYTIQGPPITQLPKSEQLSSKQSKYLSMIDTLQKDYNLNDTDGVADYHQAWWENWIDENSPSTMDNRVKMGLVRRWAFRDKSFRLNGKNIGNSNLLIWANKIDKKDHSKLSKSNLRKFEDIFLGVGADVLSFMSSVLTVNQDDALRTIKKRLDQTIKDINKSGDVKKIEKLKLEMERLLAAGGKQKLVPNEGIVFVYKGNTYKLTGTFAPLNQILGLMYY